MADFAGPEAGVVVWGQCRYMTEFTNYLTFSMFYMMHSLLSHGSCYPSRCHLPNQILPTCLPLCAMLVLLCVISFALVPVHTWHSHFTKAMMTWFAQRWNKFVSHCSDWLELYRYRQTLASMLTYLTFEWPRWGPYYACGERVFVRGRRGLSHRKIQ